jgi:hypothetical protein
MMKTLKFKDWICNLRREQYAKGHTALLLVSAGQKLYGEEIYPGERIASVTINIDGLKKDEIAVKNYSENEGMLDLMLQLGIVLPAHRTARTGFVEVTIHRINEDVIKEYLE